MRTIKIKVIHFYSVFYFKLPCWCSVAGPGAGGHHSHFNCDCMEYWTCILGGGTPHTYCGLTDHDVCCFVPDNAAPVGILPTPNRVQCGRKGFDSGKEGEAEFSEWPWHVGSTGTAV